MAETSQSALIRQFQVFRDALANDDKAACRIAIQDLLGLLEEFDGLPDDLLDAYNAVLTGRPTVAAIDEILARIDPPVAFVSWDCRERGPSASSLQRALEMLGIRIHEDPRHANNDTKGWILAARALSREQIDRAVAADRREIKEDLESIFGRGELGIK